MSSHKKILITIIASLLILTAAIPIALSHNQTQNQQQQLIQSLSISSVLNPLASESHITSKSPEVGSHLITVNYYQAYIYDDHDPEPDDPGEWYFQLGWKTKWGWTSDVALGPYECDGPGIVDFADHTWSWYISEVANFMPTAFETDPGVVDYSSRPLVSIDFPGVEVNTWHNATKLSGDVLHYYKYIIYNDAPVVQNISVTEISFLSVNFSCNVSDPEGDSIIAYEWNFGDGTTSAEANPHHEYAMAGIYNVSLRVQDSPGTWSAYKYQIIEVNKVIWTNPTITDVNVLKDLYITLNGNLTITETGELHLTHCVLNVNNGTSPLQYGVTVYGGMYINESSTITAINPANPYYFTVYEGAAFQMNDSRVEYCGVGGGYPYSDGFLVMCDNAWIENNTFTNNFDGLILYGCVGVTVLNNTAINNLWDGFNSWNSNGTNFINNTAINNPQSGFYLSASSNNNNLSGNTATNTAYGFYLSASSNNNLISNTANNNYDGFHLGTSSNNTLSGNTANGNTYYGFYLSASSNNNLTGNTATNNDQGFYLEDSSNNNLTGNTADSNNYVGFCLYQSSFNTLSSNTATDNTGVGFQLANSNSNNLSGNTANNNYDGFHLGTSSNNNNLSGNTATNNEKDGFYIEQSSYNNFTANTASNNGNYGFRLDSSSNNNLTCNTATKNQAGFYLFRDNSYNNLSGNIAANNIYYGFIITVRSEFNVLILNNATSNGYDGFQISGCDRNTLSGNTAINNYHSGFILFSSFYNILSGNKAYNNTEGFYLHYSSYNTLISDTASGNWAGFLLNYSSYNTLSSNTAANNSWGFGLLDSPYNTFSGNKATNNDNDGFYLYKSDKNILSDNNATNNGRNGFKIEVSSYNELTYNYAENNFDGFQLEISLYNTLMSNTAINNRHAGFKLIKSNNNTLRSNIAKDNPQGFSLTTSNQNNFWFNNATNSVYGFWMSDCTDNYIRANFAENCKYGFYMSLSMRNNLETNIASNSEYGFYLCTDLWSLSTQNNINFNNAVNCSQGYYYPTDLFGNPINNLEGSRLANWLIVNVTDVNGLPISNAGIIVDTRYPSGGGVGFSARTGPNGLTDRLKVAYKYFTKPYSSEMSALTSTVEVYYQGFPIEGGSIRTIDMSICRVETFRVIDNKNPVVEITTPPSDITVNTGVIWINGTFEGTGSNVINITVNDSRFTLVEPAGPPYGISGTFSFMASFIGTSEFDVEVFIEDGAGYNETATRHIIVDQDKPLVTIDYPPLGFVVFTLGVVWVNGTFNGTGSKVTSITINDSRFTLVEPTGAGPYGFTGAYSFMASGMVSGEYCVNVSIQDEAGHTETAIRQFSVIRYSEVTWTNPTINNLNVSQYLYITLNGNLIITETGELHLIHCILNVNNGTTSVEYGIKVYGGLYINESSTITTINPANPYYFTVYEGAAFQMNDSRVEYCGDGSGSWPDQQGLVVRADNAWIENNTITNCREGLFMFGSEGSTILNNSAINCLEGFRLENCMYNNLTGNYGSNNWRNFLLYNSDYNTLTSNTGTNGKVEGFKLDKSFSNTLTGNIATNNGETGFYLYFYSNNNTLSGNTASNNQYGFYLYESSYNTLSGNTANNNVYGFYLAYSLYNNLSGNTANNNGYCGFYLAASANNTLSGNTANNNNRGPGFFLSSSFNNLSGNNATNNNLGFQLYFGFKNNLTNNTAANNNQYGFHLYQSSNNVLSGNTANNNQYGFYLYSSSNNNILSGNTAKDNPYGFCLESSDYNNFTGNTATNNGEDGFRLKYSSNNNLTGNTVKNNGEYGFYLEGGSNNNNLTGNTVINGTLGYYWTSNSINNDFTGCVWLNYLRVTVMDLRDLPIIGADVKVETDGTIVYATPYFLGLDPTTDLNGLTPWIDVSYRTFTTNDTMTENITTVTVYYLGFDIFNNPRIVNMSTSHVETFQVDNVDPTVDITVPVNDTTVNTGVIWINGTFDGTGSQVVSISINDTERFELVMPSGVGPYGVIGTYTFRNKTAIPTGEFGLLVTVTDQSGLTGTASRRVIVDQDPPIVTITVPASDTTVNSGVVWINGTFDGTGSNVMSITVNDTRFTLVEPSWSPYGVTGCYSFMSSVVIETSEFDVEVIIEDQAGLTEKATRHMIVDQTNPDVAITVPPSDGTCYTGTVWINGTFDGTGSLVTNIAINDLRFTLVEPVGVGPYGVTGTYSFKALIIGEGEFGFEVTVWDQAGLKGTATRHLIFVNNTPTGEDVQITDPISGVDLTFDNVTDSGTTTVTAIETGPDPPEGFVIIPSVTGDVYYDINTTANYTGTITIAIPYDETQLTYPWQESFLKLYHWNSTTEEWEDITTWVDTENNIIYGEVTGFSIFVVMEPLDVSPPTTTISLSGTQGLEGWYISDVTITLTATDDITGVAKTEYSFDNVTWTTYTCPFSVTFKGITTVYFRSIDKVGNIEDTKSIDVKIYIVSQIDIDPDTLNLRSNGKWVTVYISLPEGYDVNEIDISSIELRFGDKSHKAAWSEVQDGVLMVKFDRVTLIEILGDVGNNSEVGLQVWGEVAGMVFAGSDTVRVISKGK